MSTILIISPEPWDAHSVSKHHYALTLARSGHVVFFHGPPEAGTRGIVLQPVERAGASLTLVRSPSVARGLAHMPAVFRNWLERRWLERLEAAAQRPMNVVWLFENSRFFDMRFAGHRTKIYQQVDLDQDFHPEIAAATANLVIALSSPIERRIKMRARHFLRLTHGVAAGQEVDLSSDILDAHFPPDRQHAVLIGNLDRAYMDVELLAELTRSHTEVRFHFVGSYEVGGRLERAVGNAANVVLWGRQPAVALPSILRRADLLLVTYLPAVHRELANPHKLMEYLASGKPILASFTEEYANRPDLVVTAADAAEFGSRFAALITDPEALADPTARRQRQAFAAANTYEKQIARIADALDAALTGPNPLRTAFR